MGKSDLGGKHKYRGDTCSQWEESYVKSYGKYHFFYHLKVEVGGGGEDHDLANEPRNKRFVAIFLNKGANNFFLSQEFF